MFWGGGVRRRDRPVRLETIGSNVHRKTRNSYILVAGIQARFGISLMGGGSRSID